MGLRVKRTVNDLIIRCFDYSGNPGRANDAPQGAFKDTFTMESLILAQDER